MRGSCLLPRSTILSQGLGRTVSYKLGQVRRATAQREGGRTLDLPGKLQCHLTPNTTPIPGLIPGRPWTLSTSTLLPADPGWGKLGTMAVGFRFLGRSAGQERWTGKRGSQSCWQAAATTDVIAAKLEGWCDRGIADHRATDARNRVATPPSAETKGSKPGSELQERPVPFVQPALLHIGPKSSSAREAKRGVSRSPPCSRTLKGST